MPIAVKLLNDQIKKISKTNTLLDMLLEFERVLDELNIYAYQNWEKGEVLDGPVLDRHYVTVKLMYKRNDMPDPAGARRLFNRDCLVKYHENELISPVKVRSYNDVTLEMKPDGKLRTKAKTKTEPIWIVEIKMPRRYVDEFNSEAINTQENDYVDPDDLNAEDKVEAEQRMQGDLDEFGGSDENIDLEGGL